MTTSTRTPAADRFMTVSGLRLHYRMVGDPDATPVVLLHGIMGHAREWDVLVRSLAEHHRVVVVDQRGHGSSDWADDYTAAALAGDLTALVERLGIGGAAVIGHSMGGMAAMIGSARRPDLVSRLVVVDVGPDTVSGELRDELAAFLTHLASASYAIVDEAVTEWSANPLARPELLRHYVEHCLTSHPDGRLVWRFDGRGLIRFFDGVDEAELWRAVDNIACPVLLVRGEHSPALSPATAAEMVRRLGDGRLVEIPDGGHDLGVEQPEAVALAVERFLAAAPPR